MPPISQTLGEFSERFMLLAALTYTVAFIVFTLDLVKSSKRIRAVEENLAASQQAEQRVLVGADMTGGSSPRGGAARLAADTTADDSMDYSGRRKLARIAVVLTVVAALIHAAGVISRGLATNRVPWGNMYEFCTTGALVVVVVFLLALIRKDLRFLGTFVVGLTLVMLCAATIGFFTPAGNVVPALQSYWLIIHVSVAVAASALFTLTFAMSVLQLIQTSRVRKLAAGGVDRTPFMRLVPSALSLENLSYRINAFAFVMWTFTLMAGAIWAEEAWGRYWGWDVKEVWTFVIWVVFAGYLHARATRGWTGTRAAWLCIIGYLCIVFNFTIVNIYFSGLHSYA
ncbi:MULTISPECIES: c-type cytochrome biogenesis protein CcsB [unclassified Arthrobacter]|uniref:c-type cytochrome biogenesis protein CcsB n=1 Tax=unclassified Arthrobacter TaxID=235627 RepID=UPI0014921F66|nr:MULTISPECIES: c-type cytochrome biogenesis protein CcsB [unclassified Arthrobacter]MBE0009512.1 c-type cytochrome biogenesis protein CcsB [Arthrobacter sp. AET 35A]NOJ60179.1 c-type cytochrome biogenesis protein CcsB [Arthrobacter sp. 260]NOJ63440.1 c-type cytochrome biogenesis protein CcsB [Arthrobacter sp. 147(2020)]